MTQGPPGGSNTFASRHRAINLLLLEIQRLLKMDMPSDFTAT